MRFAVTALLWLLTTLALAVAVPTAWAQHNIVSADGYAELAREAAGDPALQAAAASQLSASATKLIREHGYRVDPSRVHGVASAYTAGPSFPSDFAQANRAVHAWLFTRPAVGSDPWVIDLAPMLEDSALQQTLSDYHVQTPSTLTVPVTVSPPKTLQPGKLRPLARWGPWVSLGAAVLAGVCAVLTLVAARGRGRALASVGVSALLVGAAGWAAVEVARRRIDAALNHTAGDMRRLAEAMVGHAEASLHDWLNLTLAAGAALAVCGVVVAMLGSLGKPREH
ncbi:hypothetical protein A5707_19585 [Mycobacterium kyorinense]|uniref:Uncharacterized protein n=1 Tax=Mycobacterium kyorinense TaxID=487514 RepID=A0A1A2ZA16_9MYCO|nr:hypothetical protein [Mycobacterium kyorinense]OBI47479.1 hypothetical protein A5707_19585 [Mycobacterium kyorinense]